MIQTSFPFARAASFLLVLLLGAAPAVAQPEKWTLRAGILGTDYQKRLVTGFLSGFAELELDGGTGFEVAAEYRPNRTIGWELSLGRLSLDATRRDFVTRAISFDPLVIRTELQSEEEGKFRIEPIAVALLIHPLRARRFDLYVGPQVAWVRYSADVEAADREAEPGFGGKLGAELRLGDSSPWSVALEIRHLQIPHDTLEHELHTDIGIQTAALVFGYRMGSR